MTEDEDQKVGFWQRIQQFFCRHEYVYEFLPDRSCIRLQCTHCGHRTPGIWV